MKKLRAGLLFVLLFNVICDINASNRNHKDNDNNTYALVGVGALLGLGVLAYKFWPSESDEDLFFRCKKDLEKESDKLVVAHQFVHLFSPNNDSFGRYRGQTEETLYMATNFLTEYEITGDGYKKEIQVLLGKVKSSASNLKERLSAVKDKYLQVQYADLKDQCGSFIGTLQEADLYLSEHKEFFDIYFIHQSIYENFGIMISLSDEDEIIKEAVAFSSDEYPYIACVNGLDRKINQLGERYSKRAKLYPNQNNESYRLASELEYVRKIIKSSPGYTSEKKRRQEDKHQKELIRLKEKKLDQERAAQMRAQREQERKNRIEKEQKDKELRIKERKLREEKKANQLQKEALLQKEQQSCQPVNLYVTLGSENSGDNDNWYYDQYNNAYERRYSDEYNNVWVLYQMPNGMLYYACNANGYDRYKNVYKENIERPF